MIDATAQDAETIEAASAVIYFMTVVATIPQERALRFRKLIAELDEIAIRIKDSLK